MNRREPLEAEICPHCGRALVPIEQLAAVAAALARAAARLVRAHAAMRLAVPQAWLDAMRELARDTPRLAEGLACIAGACAAAHEEG